MDIRNAAASVGMACVLTSCAGGMNMGVRDQMFGVATPSSPSSQPSPATSPAPVQTAAVAPAEPGPPPWAPAHGKRRKDAFRYRYYEAAQVYHDPERAVYFTLNVSTGVWGMTAVLPVAIALTDQSFVELDMPSDKPYVHHDEIRTKYPPGQAKKAKKEKKGKGKGKGHQSESDRD